nr:terminase gpA endonuclease subunit [Pseudophaeobacter leonis]
MQSDRLEVEIVGWGLGEESWSLGYRVPWGDPLVPASNPILTIGCGKRFKQSVMSSTSQGNSPPRLIAPLASTMHSAQDHNDTSSPAKYSIVFLPCSQSSCDPIGSSTSNQGQPNNACFRP